MFITRLTVKHFRNYTNTQVSFSPKVNFIVGNNGSGKTNLLEAISILSNVKSFRNIQDVDIIQWGETSYYCTVDIEESAYNHFEVGCGQFSKRLQKKMKINDQEVKSVSEYYGRLLSVIFSPSDINLINGPPELRRRFFDSVLSKIDFSYLEALIDFRKILSSRNRILKKNKESNIINHSQLDVWDELFAKRAEEIIKKREIFIDGFSKSFVDNYTGIADEELYPDIRYKNTTGSNSAKEIIEVLKRSRKKDSIIGSTTTGPQRDDYILENSSGIQFSNYASQGQRRTAAISLKIVENEIIEEKRGDKSIILVDDIFSELDSKRRENMIDLLKRGNQVIFTMVHSDVIPINDFSDYKLFSITSPGILDEH